MGAGREKIPEKRPHLGLLAGPRERESPSFHAPWVLFMPLFVLLFYFPFH
jgi:hypothetical protein